MILELDLAQRQLTTEGITDYYWPIHLSEVQQFREQMHSALSLLIQEARNFNIHSAALFEVMILGIFNLVLTMFQTTLLYARSQEAGYQLNPTPHYSFLKMLQQNQMMVPQPLLDLLKYGPSPLKKMKLPLRFVRDIIKSFSEGVVRRRFLGPNWQEDIVTLGTHELVRAWKSGCCQKVTFLRTNFWFEPIKKLSVTLNSADMQLAHRLTSIVEDLFSSFQVYLPHVFRCYFESFVRDGFLYSKHHLQQVRKAKKIPRYLWGNTGGSVWMRLLSILVREQGGHVTGFDHAGGSSYYENLNDYHLKELLVCDRFVTFSKRQAEEIKAHSQPNQALLYRVPECVYSKKACRIYLNRKMNIIGHPKTIMYVSTIYPGERVGTNGDFMSDLTLLDWQIRLLCQLKKMGYHVTFKPHPESLIKTNQQIEKLFGSIIQQGLFEKVLYKADLFIFDTLVSTTFRDAVISGKPLVWIYFNLNKIKTEAEWLLAHRCSIVKAYFDNSRPMLDWDQLQKGIEEATLKQNSLFEHEYYGI